MAKKGLYANIHAKRMRIKQGSGEKMRKPGSEGAPSAAKLVVLPAEAFDALASRLEQPGHYDPRVARVLSRKAPWE